MRRYETQGETGLIAIRAIFVAMAILLVSPFNIYAAESDYIFKYQSLEEYEYLSEHFKAREFECSCCKAIIVDIRLLDKLEDLRAYLEMPIKITSGYRCAKHNKAVGGATHSQHMRGKAADIQVNRYTPAEVGEAAQHVGFAYIKVYKYHTHVDIVERR